MSTTVLGNPKNKAADDLRRENLYQTKCQCLSEVLVKTALIDKAEAERVAEAINAAFDRIKM